MKMKIVRLFNHRGSALLFTVIAITSIAVLGTGIYFMTSTSTFSGISANDQNRAYQLAVAGKEYALVKNFENTATLYPGGRDFTFDNGDMFRLVIEDDRIESTGIVKKGTPYEAKRTVKAKVTGFRSRADVTASDLTQSDGSNRQIAQSKEGLITTDAATGQITLGQIGDTYKSQFGAFWYKGGAAAGTCKDGRCEFGSGFRAFFVFKINASTSGADGFTFTAFNGDTATNDLYSVGGHHERGELLGYAGDSRLDSGGTTFLDYKSRQEAGFPTPLGSAKGRGIQPPKLAVEFDPYPNYCSCSSLCTNEKYCSSCTVCDSSSRCDGLSRNHMAYVYWGDNSEPPCWTTVGKNSFDDNKHGAGTEESTTDPQNSRSPISVGGMDASSYYNASSLSTSWLTSGYYAFRIEVIRKEEPAGNYKYTMKSWIKSCTDLTCATYDDTNNFANTKVKYDDTADPANLTRTFNLTEALHNKFETFFFGWTMAAGGATEEVKIARFRMNFQK